jgi:hypothetical protein
MSFKISNDKKFGSVQMTDSLISKELQIPIYKTALPIPVEGAIIFYEPDGLPYFSDGNTWYIFGGGGASAQTLQQAYLLSSHPEITLKSGATGFIIKDNGFSPVSNNIFEIQNTSGATLFTVRNNLITAANAYLTNSTITNLNTTTLKVDYLLSNNNSNISISGLKWPNSDGISGQALTTDGLGNLIFTTVATTSGSGATATLQSSYLNKVGSTDISLNNTQGALTINEGTVTVGNNLFDIRNQSNTTSFFTVVDNFVRAPNLISTTATITNLYSSNATFTNLFANTATFTRVYVSVLSAATGTFTNLYSTNASIVNLIATTATFTNEYVSNLSGGTASFTNLYSTNASIVNLIATTATITNEYVSNLSGGTASFTNLYSTNASIVNLIATTATFVNEYVSNLSGGTASFTNLYSTNASIVNLIATTTTITNEYVSNLSGGTAIFNNLYSTNASIVNLIATTATITNEYVSNLSGGTAIFNNLYSSNASIVNLIATTATITNEYVSNLSGGTAIFSNLYATNVSFSNVNITNATINTPTIRVDYLLPYNNSNIKIAQLNWPSGDGAVGQALTTDGAGNLIFATVATTSGSGATATLQSSYLNKVGSTDISLNNTQGALTINEGTVTVGNDLFDIRNQSNTTSFFTVGNNFVRAPNLITTAATLSRLYITNSMTVNIINSSNGINVIPDKEYSLLSTTITSISLGIGINNSNYIVVSGTSATIDRWNLLIYKTSATMDYNNSQFSLVQDIPGTIDGQYLGLNLDINDNNYIVATDNNLYKLNIFSKTSSTWSLLQQIDLPQDSSRLNSTGRGLSINNNNYIALYSRTSATTTFIFGKGETTWSLIHSLFESDVTTIPVEIRVNVNNNNIVTRNFNIGSNYYVSVYNFTNSTWNKLQTIQNPEPSNISTFGLRHDINDNNVIVINGANTSSYAIYAYIYTQSQPLVWSLTQVLRDYNSSPITTFFDLRINNNNYIACSRINISVPELNCLYTFEMMGDINENPIWLSRNKIKQDFAIRFVVVNDNDIYAVSSLGSGGIIYYVYRNTRITPNSLRTKTIYSDKIFYKGYGASIYTKTANIPNGNVLTTIPCATIDYNPFNFIVNNSNDYAITIPRTGLWNVWGQTSTTFSVNSTSSFLTSVYSNSSPILSFRQSFLYSDNRASLSSIKKLTLNDKITLRITHDAASSVTFGDILGNEADVLKFGIMYMGDL